MLKRKALPVAPVNLVEMSSPRWVRKVSHWAQLKGREGGEKKVLKFSKYGIVHRHGR